MPEAHAKISRNQSIWSPMPPPLSIIREERAEMVMQDSDDLIGKFNDRLLLSVSLLASTATRSCNILGKLSVN